VVPTLSLELTEKAVRREVDYKIRIKKVKKMRILETIRIMRTPTHRMVSINRVVKRTLTIKVRVSITKNIDSIPLMRDNTLTSP